MIDLSTIAARAAPSLATRGGGSSPRDIPAPATASAPASGLSPVRGSRPTAGANLVQAQELPTEAGELVPGDLSDEEQRIVRELRRRDAEVRRHEQAHRMAGGPYAGAPTYQYTRGPDGHFYAVSGEVKIDISSEGSPEATIRKMEVVIRAALAPADPSGQDRAVANQAKQIKAAAVAEARAARLEEQSTQAGQQPRTAAQAYNDAASMVSRNAQGESASGLVTRA